MASDLDVSAVGREFVRQYYTVLNQRPDCLHQFFTQDSSFVHGGYERPGEEKPASRGQSLIHQKVMALGFHDCRTKILQVDCQKTIGNAVLVQVSGELSKSGEAMRRFMQSFVLVQQAPKNFYVHNDIFRYQDEVFSEGPEEVTIGKGSESYTVGDEESSAERLSSPEKNPTNEIRSESNPGQFDVGDGDSLPIATVIASQTQVKEEEEEEEEEKAAVSEEVPEAVPEVIEAPERKPQSKGFSWASLASKNVPAPAKPQAAVKPERKTEVPAKPSIPSSNAPSTNSSTATSNNKPRSDEVVRASDNQQLFIGNLPHNVSEQEIRNLFTRFGTVLNIKVNRKGASKDLPNFGFVVFDSQEAVAKALRAKPIMLNGKRRINIEEKKDQSSFRNRPRGPFRASRDE